MYQKQWPLYDPLFWDKGHCLSVLWRSGGSYLGQGKQSEFFESLGAENVVHVALEGSARALCRRSQNC